MESRKRPHTDDVDPSITKKRVLADSVGNPHVNGTHIEHDEPREGDSLELFRKQAIYRRMKHYSRENERSQSRIAQLERQNNITQAGFTAIKACWTQVVDTIRMLVKPELHPESNSNVQDLFDLTVHIQEEAFQDLSNLLNEYSQTTQALLAKFVELSGSSEAARMRDNACIECLKAQTECLSLRSQMDVIEARLQDGEMQRDQYHAALLAAESRVERIIAESMQTQQGAKKLEVKNDASEEPQKPFSPEQAGSPQINGPHEFMDSDILHDLVKSREARVTELEQEVAALRGRNLALETEAKSLTLPLLASNPVFIHLYDQAKSLHATVETQRAEIASLSNAKTAHIPRKDWDEKITNSANQVTQEYKNMLAKRDAELARIRDQRDQYRMEINERKQMESVRLASNEEIRKLAESRADRIIVLESELRRIKTQLAANAGYEELMLFFCSGNLEEAEFLESLKSRVIAAEDRAIAMEQTLASQTDSADLEKHMKAEAEARRQLAELTRELDQYRSLFGDVSSLSPDTQLLVQQHHEKEKEIQRLRLLDQQREQAETALYTEIDKLSTAWEALDRQVQGKIYDLTGMEERVSRANNERMKAENKFWAAVREKEAIDAERKNLVRNNEKQAQVVENLVLKEKSFQVQIVTYEEESERSKKAIEVFRARVDELEKYTQDLSMQILSETSRANDALKVVKDKEGALDQKRAELRKLEDGLIRSRKTADKESARLKDMALKASQQKQDGADSAYLEQMLSLLKCSTCKLNFRNTLITKCMHTFCKECVESRITTRQRKCPFCSLPFSQSDVQNMFFQ